jgi:aerobic-type carbon monoxide dehydrogenase small subunit (CoxS/CutS family)
MQQTISFKLNGKPTTVTVDPDRLLLWVLRHDLGLTGTKYGCGEGLCGACTVVVDKEAVRSCTTQMKDVAGKSVTTIEGLSQGKRMNRIQKAFLDHNAFQCGYCTPGMIMTAHALLLKYPNPTRADILKHMNNNLCRCGSHNRVVEAIEQAARERA